MANVAAFRWRLLLVELVDTSLEKARVFKYIMRVPTGKQKPRYRYYYAVPGRSIVTADSLKPGATFTGEDGKVWDVVSFKYPEVTVADIDGNEKTYDMKEFSRLVNKANAKAIEQERKRKFQFLARELAKFYKYTTRKGDSSERLKQVGDQGQFIQELLQEFNKAGWLTKDQYSKINRRVSKFWLDHDKQVSAHRNAARNKEYYQKLERKRAFFKRIAKAVADALAGKLSSTELQKLKDSTQRSFSDVGIYNKSTRDFILSSLDNAMQHVREQARKRTQRLVVPSDDEAAYQAALRGENRKKTTTKREVDDAGASVAGRKDGGLGLRGDDDVMLISDESGQGQEQAITYRLVPAADLIPSHIPSGLGNFKKNPSYPEGVQERTYHRSKMAQQQVIQHARELKPAFLINTNPDALHGPPIITPKGVVLGGNSRTMTMQVAYRDYPEQAMRYEELLKKKARQFGFSPDDVDKIKNPVLVREVSEPANKEHARDLVRRYNESFTRAMDPREEQVALARRMSTETLSDLANQMQEDETFNDFLRSKRGADFVRSLMRDGLIDKRNVDRWVNSKGKYAGLLNEDGRNYVTRLILGKFVPDPDLLEDLGQRLREQVAGAIPYMIQAAEYADDYALVDPKNPEERSPLRTALETYVEMKDRGVKLPSKLWNQMSLLDASGQAKITEYPIRKDKLAQAILAAILTKPSKMGAALRKFVQTAKSNSTSTYSLFGDDSRTPAYKALFDALGFTSGDPIAEVEKVLKKKGKRGSM